MTDHTYRCATARAAARRIWNADFFLGSFNELVESADPDSVVASVGLSEPSVVEGILKMVVTLYPHPWSQEIAEYLIEDALNSEDSLHQWSVEFKKAGWTFTMTWRP